CRATVSCLELAEQPPLSSRLISMCRAILYLQGHPKVHSRCAVPFGLRSTLPSHGPTMVYCLHHSSLLHPAHHVHITPACACLSQPETTRNPQYHRPATRDHGGAGSLWPG